MGCISSKGSLWGHLCPCLFQLLDKGCPHSLAQDPFFSTFKASNGSRILLTWLLIPSSPYEDPYGYNGPTQVIQGNPPILRNLSSIYTFAK